MSKILIACAALGALVACAARAEPAPLPNAARPPQSIATPAPESRAASGVSCEIRATPTRNGVLIEAFAHAARAVSGEYSLVITKSGGGGSSDIDQGGPIEARTGATLALGASEVGMERNARYRAVLTLRDAQGELCRRERRS